VLAVPFNSFLQRLDDWISHRRTVSESLEMLDEVNQVWLNAGWLARGTGHQ
jgi:hypothetical protein